MMQLPFTPQEFFAVFGRYNAAVWPAQWVLYGIAAIVSIDVIQNRRPRLVLIMLALLWIWMGLVYHLAFFADINPAAPVFAFVFLAEAGILAWFAHRRFDRAGLRPSPLARSIGRALVAYALLGYPLLGLLAGHRYPETPTFGAPCPTTIFTIGVLVGMFADVPWWVLTIPVAWAAIGTVAALQLGVPEDLGLSVAGLLGIVAARTSAILQKSLNRSSVLREYIRPYDTHPDCVRHDRRPHP